MKAAMGGRGVFGGRMVLSDVWREAGRPRQAGRLAEESQSSYELRSAVTGVEQRGTGRWIREG